MTVCENSTVWIMWGWEAHIQSIARRPSHRVGAGVPSSCLTIWQAPRSAKAVQRSAKSGSWLKSPQTKMGSLWLQDATHSSKIARLSSAGVRKPLPSTHGQVAREGPDHRWQHALNQPGTFVFSYKTSHAANCVLMTPKCWIGGTAATSCDSHVGSWSWRDRHTCRATCNALGLLRMQAGLGQSSGHKTMCCLGPPALIVSPVIMGPGSPGPGLARRHHLGRDHESIGMVAMDGLCDHEVVFSMMLSSVLVICHEWI